MRMPHPGGRILALLVVAVVASVAGFAVRSSGTLGWLGRDTIDARFSLRGDERTPRNVVVVGLDNGSLGRLPRYPFSRRFHARIIERLHAAGARLIVYDISFDRPTTARADRALFEAARRAAPMIFATSLISDNGSTQVLGGDKNLASIGDRAAAANLLPDDDGVLRHLLESVNGLPSIAAAVGEQVGRQRIARSPLRGGWIDFSGPPESIPSIPFVRVLNGRFAPASVRGKVVVVGATASLLQDLHDTPAGSPMSGPEVQAAAISTVLRGFPLRSAPSALALLLIVLLGVLVPLAGLRLGTIGAIVVGFGAAVLWSLTAQLSFDSGLVLDYINPMVSLLIGTSGTASLGLWADSRERSRLRMLFAADAPSVVQRTLNEDGRGPLEPTAIVAGYRIEQVVGRGGMGVVYEASQLALGRPVAIKLIAPGRAEDPTFRERFKAESRIAASIEHANVIPVYEAGEDDGILFIAMRLVNGLDLARVLGREGALDPARTARLIEQLGGAIDAAHARGLVHRDIKPANVLIAFGEPEHVYLTDFGVAKQLGSVPGITRTDQWVGTLDYLAPEQILGERVGASADIYALAGVLYHCLTGQVPFPRDTDAAKLWAQMNAKPPALAGLRPELPSALDDVIARGMAKDSSLRFTSAAELTHAYCEALGIAVTRPYHRGDPLPADPSAPTSISER